MLLQLISERGRQVQLDHGLEIGTVEKYIKALNPVFCCYILYDNNPIRLQMRYGSLNFEKGNEAFELKIPYNFGSIRIQKQGTYLRKNRISMKCPSMAVKHTRPSDGWRHGIQALTLGTLASHCVNFWESDGARV